MKKVKKTDSKHLAIFVLLIIAIVASVYLYNRYRYKAVAHPVDIPESSFLHQLVHIDLGQSEQEVELILGKPQKTYPFKSECMQDSSYTYKRWTDKVTQSSAQLVFDGDKNLSFIVLKNGNTLLDLKTLTPQFNFPYVVGESRFSDIKKSIDYAANTNGDINKIAGRSLGELRISTIKQLSMAKDSAYYFVVPPIKYDYFRTHIRSTFLGILKETSIFGCQAVANALKQYDDKLPKTEGWAEIYIAKMQIIPLSYSLFNDHPLKFEMNIRPKPIVFPDDNVMAKLGNINLGQSEEAITQILGSPDKQMVGAFEPYQSNKKIPYTYMRWADEETGGNVQLLFDESHRLTLVVVHKGFMNLDLQALFPQYDVPFVVGKSTRDDFENMPVDIVGGFFTDFSYKNEQDIEIARYVHFYMSSHKAKSGLVYTLPYDESNIDPWSWSKRTRNPKNPKFSPTRVFSLSNNLQLFKDSDREHYHRQMDSTLLGVLVSFPPKYFEHWDELSCRLIDKSIVMCKNYVFMN